MERLLGHPQPPQTKPLLDAYGESIYICVHPITNPEKFKDPCFEKFSEHVYKYL